MSRRASAPRPPLAISPRLWRAGRRKRHQGGRPMSTPLRIGDLTVHRIVEMEIPFTDPYEFIPGLTPAQLEANRGWMQEMGALDAASGKLVLCFQSYVVRTPHHTILIDSCVGNDKERTARPVWHRKKDDAWMRG